jgi:hypothetical protein
MWLAAALWSRESLVAFARESRRLSVYCDDEDVRARQDGGVSDDSFEKASFWTSSSRKIQSCAWAL